MSDIFPPDPPPEYEKDLKHIAETAEVLGLVPRDQQVVERAPRGVQLTAALGLLAATGVAVGGLVWEVTYSGSETALTLLGTIATAGLSGLLVLAGAKRGEGS